MLSIHFIVSAVVIKGQGIWGEDMQSNIDWLQSGDKVAIMPETPQHAVL